MKLVQSQYRAPEFLQFNRHFCDYRRGHRMEEAAPHAPIEGSARPQNLKSSFGRNPL